MLRLPPFELRRPSTLAEAAAILAGAGADSGGSVRLVAGGTDLWPNMKRGVQLADTVVSLLSIPDLAGFEDGTGSGSGNGELRLGATTTLNRIAASPRVRRRFPALAEAARSISTPVLRNMGTIGGNLCLDTRCNYYNQSEEWRRSVDYCMKEEGTVCWVAPSSRRCLAVAAADTAPVLCALGATARLVSVRGERQLPVAELYRDDGIEYLTKAPDEILVDVTLPPSSDAGRCRSAFLKLRRRGSIDFAVLSVAAAVWLDGGGRVRDAALWLGSVASHPRPVPAACEMLRGHALDEDLIAEAARLCRRRAMPLDNTDFTAQWRGVMVERYAAEALRRCRSGASLSS